MYIGIGLTIALNPPLVPGLNVTLARLTSSAAAISTLSGAGAPTLAPLTSAGAGALPVVGAGDQTLAALTLAGAGVLV